MESFYFSRQQFSDSNQQAHHLEQQAQVRDDYWLQRLVENDLLSYQHRSLLSDNRDNAVEDERICKLGKVLKEKVTHLQRLKLLLEKVWESDSEEEEEDKEDNGSSSTPVGAFTHGSIESHTGILDFIASSQSLLEFHLSIYKANAAFLDAYISSIQKNPRICKFRWEAFAPEHIPALCHLLESTTTLKELEIGEWEWGQNVTLIWEEHQLERFCRALALNQSLQRIVFHSVVLEHDYNNDNDHNNNHQQYIRQEQDNALNQMDLSTWMKDMPRNQSVKQVIFEEDSSLDVTSAHKLLYIFQNIQCLELSQFPKPIMNIFYGLQYTTSIQEFACLMVNPYFDMDAYPLLTQFIERQEHLRSFRFEYSDQSGGYVSPATRKQEFLNCLFQGLRLRQNTGNASFSSLRLDYGFMNLFTIEKLADIEGLEEMDLKFYYEAEMPPSVEELLLKPTCCLRKLFLDIDALGFRAMTDLQRWLRQNSTIHALSFSTVFSGALSIEKFCWGNSKIQELEVYGCSPELEYFLKEKTCRLKRLTIRNDTTIDQGFLSALQENKSLETVSFANCPVPHLELLLEILPGMTHWKDLSVTGCILLEDDQQYDDVYRGTDSQSSNGNGNANATGSTVELSSTKALLVRKLKENKTLFRFRCDLDEDGYSFQSELKYLCLRNKMLHIRSLIPPDRVDLFPLDVLQTAASFL